MQHLNRLSFIVLFLLLHLSVQGQKNPPEHEGIYGDWTLNGTALITELELKKDGHFKLRTADYVYPQTHISYTNEGKWISNGKEIILNPDLKKHKPQLTLKERNIGLTDSIEIKINTYTALFEKQQFIEKTKVDFDVLTLYFNKRRKFVHLTRANYKEGSCAWAPRVRNKITVDATNSFRIAKKDVHTLGVFTYGFTNFVTLEIKDKKADYFEIDIVMPIDKERMPRNKKIIIKGKRAFFYERNGKVALSATPLLKKRI